MIKVDIGCGSYKKEEFIGVDVVHTPQIDIIADCCHLPFRDHCVDLLYALSLLEHFTNPYEILEEVYRVVKTPNGICEFIVPNVGTYSAEQDPTHKFVTDLAHWHRIIQSFFEKVIVQPFGVKFQSSARKWIAKQIALIEDGLWDLAQGFSLRCTHSKDIVKYLYVPHFIEDYARESGREYLTPRQVVTLPPFHIDYTKYNQLKEDMNTW